jgi:hypothetical protein
MTVSSCNGPRVSLMKPLAGKDANCPRSRFIPDPVYARDGAASTQRIASLPFPKTVTEHFDLRSSIRDPEIRLQKCTRPPAVRIKTHHPRTPDVGIGILIFMPNYRAGAESPEIIEYYGEYLGHGQSKTAFELNHSGALFHGKVLKVAQANDMEPSVFIEAAKIGLTTSILYNCAGIDAHSGRRFHCWITDRTIPLDDFCRDDDAIKDRCSLAAFCCILRAALHGLYLSDCHFFNFGVQLNESATEHLVVIIDAGSRGIHRDAKWKKSEINTKIMHKFWKACAKEAATNAEIQNLWTYGNAESIATCLKIASEAWQSSPFLTKSQESTCAIWQSMIAKDSFRRTVAHAKSAYNIMTEHESPWDTSNCTRVNSGDGERKEAISGKGCEEEKKDEKEDEEKCRAAGDAKRRKREKAEEQSRGRQGSGRQDE